MSFKGERLKDEGSKTQVVIAGGTAGLISRFVIAPLDVVKIRLQLQTHSLSDPRYAALDLRGGPTYRGTLPTLRHIIAAEGLPGLWKGNVPAELMYVSYAAVQFSAYRSATLLLHSLPPGQRLSPAAESFVAGASAGAAATAVTYPLDLLRTRFAAQGPGERVYPSLRSAIPTIYRDEGVPGFFRGLGPALAQIIPSMGVFFASYETLRLVAADRLHLPWGGGDAVAGVVASVTAKTVVFPLDLVRKRIQVQGPTREKYVHRNIPEYKGWVGALGTIVRTEGPRGLYRGLMVSLVKAAPSSAVTMWTYERVLGAMIAWEKSGAEKERAM